MFIAGWRLHNLSATCKRIRHEFVSALYGNDRFELSCERMEDYRVFALGARSWFHRIRNIRAYLRVNTRVYYARFVITALDVHVTEASTLVLAYQGSSADCCICLFVQRARDVDAGIIGSQG